jgi:hypothetical protein
MLDGLNSTAFLSSDRVMTNGFRLASGENRTLLEVGGVRLRAFCTGDGATTTATLDVGGDFPRNIVGGSESLRLGQKDFSGGGFLAIGQGTQATGGIDSGWFNIVGAFDPLPPVALNGSFLVRGLAGTLQPCLFEASVIQSGLSL